MDERRPQLTLPDLLTSAKAFCQAPHRYPELFGRTDGKRIGTFIEAAFKAYLQTLYDVRVGSAARGLDLPEIDTDIKVTSFGRPQSSSPYSSPREKIYGLGYNILLFLYIKNDDPQDRVAELRFVRSAFIERSRTADHETTRGILEILSRGGDRIELVAFLAGCRLPGGDELIYNALAEEILTTPPTLGYLTISRAPQWRLTYRRIVGLGEAVSGVEQIV